MSRRKMNLPNKLTVIRFAAIPVIIALLMIRSVSWLDYVAAFLFVAAAFTDMIDGKLARKHNIVTDFGKLMDPLADKTLVVSVLMVLATQGRVNVIPVIIIIVRELAVTGLRAVAASSPAKKVIAASIWGKLKTVVQMTTVTMLMLDGIFSLIPFPIIPIMVVAMTVLTVISGAEYFIQYKDCFKDY